MPRLAGWFAGKVFFFAQAPGPLKIVKKGPLEAILEDFRFSVV
jgi:hypothetical protein